MPLDKWGHYEEDGSTLALFDQTFRYIPFLSYPIGIVTNSTVKNPVQINNRFYNCEMFGNGKVEHYGGRNSPYPANHMTLSCNSTTQN